MGLRLVRNLNRDLSHFWLLALVLVHRARFYIGPLARLVLVQRARFCIELLANPLLHHPQKRSLRFPFREDFEVEVLSAVLQQP